MSKSLATSRSSIKSPAGIGFENLAYLQSIENKCNFKSVRFGKPVSDNSMFRTTYMHKQTVDSMISYRYSALN